MPRSSLARMQQAMVFVILASALAAMVLLWDRSPTLALAAGLAIALAHALVLAGEFILMPLVSRGDPTPQPSRAQLLRAWWAEVVLDAEVFGWRQPFAWQGSPDNLQQGGAGTHGIVFIHGFICNRGFWRPWMREARQRGHPFIAVNLEPVFGSIDDYVPIIDAAVARMAHATGRPPVLVCHSMGGLAARAWLRACGDPGRVAHVVTIGTPHGGTWMARFSRLTNGRQMRLGGEWCAALAREEPPARHLFTCWYSNCDNVVFPPATATLSGADNRFVPGVAHVDLAFRPAVIRDTFALVRAL